jgi:cytochrome bd ubiquinol oxidase subunit I
MVNFWEVLFNPVAVDKFLHTISSGFLLASFFVLAVSSWFLIKRREELMARRSILIAGVFGLLSSLMVAYTGDKSARTISQVQPVKFASMEALYKGKSNAGLIAIGFLKSTEETIGDENVKGFAFRIEIPSMLSILTSGTRDGYVQGLFDHILGNTDKKIMSVAEKMARGKEARKILTDYKRARMLNETETVERLRADFRDKRFQEEYFRYFGYAFISKPEDVIPSVPVAFYSFHFMVILGFTFIMIFAAALFYLLKGTITKNRWFLWIALLSLPLPFIASELGWILTEVGRQPWIIQDMMPVSTAVSNITSGSVMTTFILFAVLFTVLLISEVSIMIRQIKTGPKH